MEIMKALERAIEATVAKAFKKHRKQTHRSQEVVVSGLKGEIDELKSIVQNLSRRLDEISETSDNEKQKEKFYQKWLEQVFDGGHKTVAAGITDISTEYFDLEIKTFKDWKCGLRQIHAYNLCTKAENKVLALFDAPDKWLGCKRMIDTCTAFNVRLILLSPDKMFKNVSPASGTSFDVDWSADSLSMKELLSEGEKDEYKAFRALHVLKNSEEYCGWTGLKIRFKTWFEQSHRNDRIPADSVIKLYFEKHFGSKCKNHNNGPGSTVFGWKGWVLI